MKPITRPGKRLQFAIENGHRKLVDLPIKSMVIFHSYVSLPEGNSDVRDELMNLHSMLLIGFSVTHSYTSNHADANICEQQPHKRVPCRETGPQRFFRAEWYHIGLEFVLGWPPNWMCEGQNRPNVSLKLPSCFDLYLYLAVNKQGHQQTHVCVFIFRSICSCMFHLNDRR